MAVLSQPNCGESELSRDSLSGHLGLPWRSVPRWVSLPSVSPIRTAEELLASIPNAAYVGKFYPQPAPSTACNGYRWDGANCTPVDTLDVLGTSPGGACTTTPHPDAGGMRKWLLLHHAPGEGYQVESSDPRMFNQFGNSGPVSLPPPLERRDVFDLGTLQQCVEDEQGALRLRSIRRRESS